MVPKSIKNILCAVIFGTTLVAAVPLHALGFSFKNGRAKVNVRMFNNDPLAFYFGIGLLAVGVYSLYKLYMHPQSVFNIFGNSPRQAPTKNFVFEQACAAIANKNLDALKAAVENFQESITSERDRENNTLLLRALDSGNDAIAEYVIRLPHNDFKAVNCRGETPFICAVRGGCSERVINLLAAQESVDVLAQDNRNNNALHHAHGQDHAFVAHVICIMLGVHTATARSENPLYQVNESRKVPQYNWSENDEAAIVAELIKIRPDYVNRFFAPRG